MFVIRVDPVPYGSVRRVLAEGRQNRRGSARSASTMATVQYDSKENKGNRFRTGRYGRYSIRIDANRHGVYPWLITLEGRSVRKGWRPRSGVKATASSPR